MMLIELKIVSEQANEYGLKAETSHYFGGGSVQKELTNYIF